MELRLVLFYFWVESIVLIVEVVRCRTFERNGGLQVDVTVCDSCSTFFFREYTGYSYVEIVRVLI